MTETQNHLSQTHNKRTIYGREYRTAAVSSRPENHFILLWIALIVMLLNIFLPSMMDRTQQVRFDQFSDQLKEDNVDEVYVTTNNNEIVYMLKMTIKHSVECHLQNRRDSGCQPSDCWMVRM